MVKLPEQLLQSLEGVAGFNREAFLQVHESGEQVTSIRFNPLKLEGGELTSFATNIDSAVPWNRYGYYLKQRPSFTFDPLFHAGCYYVQEASSMFLEQAFRQLADLSAPLKVLDLAAAPGGKSTHILSLISEESLLVSNEVIRSRSNILVDNIIKWGSGNAFVTNNDPSAFQKLRGFFDVIVVDAPCSGSGLFRKDVNAIGEWSTNNVQLCWQRQQRILSDVLPALKEGGLLIYSTCSYSQEEDEDIADWLISNFDLVSEKLSPEPSWQIVETHASNSSANGYRFYPHRVKGEGFYMSCFRKTSGVDAEKIKTKKLQEISKSDENIVRDWLIGDDLLFTPFRNSISALRSGTISEFQFIDAHLNLLYAGTRVGEIMKNKLVPDHALAMSRLISSNVPRQELTYDQAIKYLQKQETDLSLDHQGWQLVTYQSHNLGWVNVLKNRYNNSYPKELRILKQHNDSAFDN